MSGYTPMSPVEGGFISSRGHFVNNQLFDRFPMLSPFYTNFEKSYEAFHGVDFTAAHWEIPLTCVTVYLLAIFFGRRYMATRERFNLRYQLAGWNLFLSTFSFCGAFRTVPHLLANIGSMSLGETICRPAGADWGEGACGLWVQLFIFSKIPELWDTFYIVARCRPLLFLHWYHHVTVLLYCWHSYATEAPQALYFVAMNYSVHAVMYGYYCLMALKMKPKWLPPWLITVAQISQMVVGTAVQISSMVMDRSGANCGFNKGNLISGGLMYSSYFALFFKFAIERFVLKPRAERAAAKKLA